MSKLIKFLFVCLFSIGTAYAQWTTIRTPGGEAVQCNGWGWVEGNYQTAWHNPCTPLEVRANDGETIYSISTTENKCEGDQVALFHYSRGDSEIKFMGCYGIAAGYQQSIHR